MAAAAIGAPAAAATIAVPDERSTAALTAGTATDSVDSSDNRAPEETPATARTTVTDDFNDGDVGSTDFDDAPAPSPPAEDESVPPGVDIPCPGCGTDNTGGTTDTTGTTGSVDSTDSVDSTGSVASPDSSDTAESGSATTSLVSSTGPLVPPTASGPDTAASEDNSASGIAARPDTSFPVDDADETSFTVLGDTTDPEDDPPEDVLTDDLVSLDAEPDDPPDAPVSAPATPGEVTTTTPIPKAAANAPTRPT